MKLLNNTPLFFSFLKLTLADREYLGLLPHNKCGSITKPQHGFWVSRGEGSTNRLQFHPECEGEGEENGKCTIMCRNYETNLILDRTREGSWDRALGRADSPQKKYLVKCKCETWQEDDGTVTTQNCEWKPRRYWKEEQYRDDYKLGDAGEGDEPWVQPTWYPEDALVLRRKKRALSQPRMTFYCEDEAPQHIRDDWMIKPHDLGENRSVRQHEDNRGFPTCGNMYEIFPQAAQDGGEWNCRMNTTDPITGRSSKEVVSALDVPHGAICSWGCNGSNSVWEAKEARFSCEKPWIARPTGKFALKEIWRRFRGYGLRVYKQGMLDCSIHDDNLLKK